jgi:hypothetical protein
MCNNTEVENGTLIVDDDYDPNAAQKVNWSAEEQVSRQKLDYLKVY